MLDYLIDLRVRINAVNLEGVVAPGTPLEAGEVAIGEELPDFLKKFFVVREQLREELWAECKSRHESMDAIVRTLTGELTDEEVTATAQHILVHQRMDVVDDIFWQEVREVSPRKMAGKSMAIRNGWQLVVSSAVEEHVIALELPLPGRRPVHSPTH